MFHCIINFSLITFICYAVAAPAKAIVGSGKAKKPRRAHHTAPKRHPAAPVVLPPKKAARSHLRAA